MVPGLVMVSDGIDVALDPVAAKPVRVTGEATAVQVYVTPVNTLDVNAVGSVGAPEHTGGWVEAHITDGCG